MLNPALTKELMEGKGNKENTQQFFDVVFVTLL